MEGTPLFDSDPFLGSDQLISPRPKPKPIIDYNFCKPPLRLNEKKRLKDNKVLTCKVCNKYIPLYGRVICETCFENKMHEPCELCEELIPHNKLICDKCWEDKFGEEEKQKELQEKRENDEALQHFLKKKEEQKEKEEERKKQIEEINRINQQIKEENEKLIVNERILLKEGVPRGTVIIEEPIAKKTNKKECLIM